MWKLRLSDRPNLSFHLFSHFETVLEDHNGRRIDALEQTTRGNERLQQTRDYKSQSPLRCLLADRRSDLSSFQMAPTPLVKKTGSKPKSKPAEKKKPQPPPEPVDVPSPSDEGWEDEDSGEESESDEEDDGVDEAGFEKLIKALGDDSLDEYDQAQLVALAGDGEDDEESEEGENAEKDEESREVSDPEEEGDEAEEGGSGSHCEGEGAEEGESSGDEDVLALDELEDVELHPDAVPLRGIKVIDNKVRATRV